MTYGIISIYLSLQNIIRFVPREEPSVNPTNITQLHGGEIK